MVSAMKIAAAVLIGSASAQSTTTTPAPAADCTYAGVANFGVLSTQCCASAQIMVATALLTSTTLPANLKGLVTSCVPTDTGLGSCVGTGSWPHTPDTTAYLTAAGLACASSQACGTAVLQGLAAATSVNSMNPTLTAGFDANSDGVLDTCAALAAAATSSSTTTSTTTTITTTTATTTAAQASDTNSAAVTGATVSGAVAVFATGLAALAA